MKEIWKDIPGYEGIYYASNTGLIRSKNGILKPSVHRGGYLKVVLCVKGHRKTFQVHRLIAQTFIPNPNNLPQINHKDEVKTNNFVFVSPDGTVDLEKSNLEWCTMEYNIFYGTGQARSKRRGLPANTKAVCQYSLDGELIATYPSGMEAQRKTGIKQASINNCCHHISHQMCGFVWRFKDDPFSPVPPRKKCAGKKTIQMDLDGNIIKVWPSALAASLSLGLKCSRSIRMCIKGEIPTCKGYKWKYLITSKKV